MTIWEAIVIGMVGSFLANITDPLLVSKCFKNSCFTCILTDFSGLVKNRRCSGSDLRSWFWWIVGNDCSGHFCSERHSRKLLQIRRSLARYVKSRPKPEVKQLTVSMFIAGGGYWLLWVQTLASVCFIGWACLVTFVTLFVSILVLLFLLSNEHI